MIRNQITLSKGNAIMKKKIAITIRSFGANTRIMDILNSQYTIGYSNETGSRLTREELCRVLEGTWGVIAGTEPFDKVVLDSARDLKVISRVGVGTDSIDLQTAQERGIAVYTTSATTIQPVAEHTLALILCVLKNIAGYAEATRHGDYRVKSTGLLSGKTVGIIGIGRIGFRVGEMLSCLGCRIVFWDPYLLKPVPPEWKRAGSINDLLSAADIISLHTPPQKNNEPIMTRQEFNQCRNGVVLINTARGSLVDETALIEALQTGKVAGAGLDVTNTEPYSGPLCEFSQVIITPHVASNTRESRSAMEEEAVNNLIMASGRGKP